MNTLPWRSRQHLESICQDMPKTPYHGSKAIADYLFNNLKYGCDEAISQGNWARLPHQIKTHANCQDFGTLSYLMAMQLGLDCSLGEAHNFDGTDQRHLFTIVRASQKDYIIQHCSTKEVKLGQNSIETKDGKYLSDKINYVSFPQVLQMFEDGKNPRAVLDFFRQGQQLEELITKIPVGETGFDIVYKTVRGLKYDEQGFSLFKSIEIPGCHLVFRKKSMSNQDFSFRLELAGRKNNFSFSEVYPVLDVESRVDEGERLSERLDPKVANKLRLNLVHSLVANQLIVNLENVRGFKKRELVEPNFNFKSEEEVLLNSIFHHAFQNLHLEKRALYNNARVLYHHYDTLDKAVKDYVYILSEDMNTPRAKEQVRLCTKAEKLLKSTKI